MLTPKLPYLSVCVNLCQHAQNKLIPSAYYRDTVNFRVLRPDWPDPFLTMPKQKIFDQLLVFMNLYQHAKNYAVSSICSGEMADLKILESDWLRPRFFPNIGFVQEHSKKYKFSL